MFPKRSIILIIVTIVMIYFGNFGANISRTLMKKFNKTRGVIVTIIRSTNRSILLTINMIHSVTQFHSTSDGHPYPFLIFHDPSFTSSMREQILSCVLKNNSQINISFALIDFQTSVRPANGSRMDKPMGYRLMCRFWTYDVFYHPAVIQGRYDYLMRMDDDSYFSDATTIDLFQYANIKNLDYIYRSRYRESIERIEPILQRFLNSSPQLLSCIYNNFFVIRLKWYYESERVRSFVQELIRDDLILREYIGDGCVHAVMLKVDNEVKAKHVTRFSYGHNTHVMAWGRRQYVFKLVNDFYKEINKSCRQLTVLRGAKGILTRINIS
jgi:hypothetical protein